jgi:hypothetical protein
MVGETLSFAFVAERLALDFLNTISTVQGRQQEAMPTFDAAVAWFQQAGVLAAGDGAPLKAFRRSKAADDALRDLRAFRTEMRAMLERYLEHGDIEPRFRETINERMRGGVCSRVLVPEGAGYVLRIDYHFLHPRDLMMPLVNDMAELVAYEPV